MKLNVKDLSIGDIRRQWSVPAERVNEIFAAEPHNSLRVDGPVSVEAAIHMTGAEINVKGSFRVSLAFICDRCGEPASSPLAGDFYFVLLPGNEDEADEQIEEGDEVFDLGYYDGADVDLTPYIVEQVMISVPVKLLCNDTCKGLCTSCGANLNTESCRCRRAPATDNPFNTLIHKEL